MLHLGKMLPRHFKPPHETPRPPLLMPVQRTSQGPNPVSGRGFFFLFVAYYITIQRRAGRALSAPSDPHMQDLHIPELWGKDERRAGMGPGWLHISGRGGYVVVVVVVREEVPAGWMPFLRRSRRAALIYPQGGGDLGAGKRGGKGGGAEEVFLSHLFPLLRYMSWRVNRSWISGTKCWLFFLLALARSSVRPWEG